jgi:hypothetical protein
VRKETIASDGGVTEETLDALAAEGKDEETAARLGENVSDLALTPDSNGTERCRRRDVPAFQCEGRNGR